MKITGFMVIKNEWPLAAVSISHALIHTLDEIYVVDNGSSDGSWEGLRILQRIFPGRIFSFYYESSSFNQKAVHHALSHLVPSAGDEPRWGVFLDADEFTIWTNPLPFRNFIESINLDWGALIVELENFIPPVDFSEYDLNSYAEIMFRAAALYEFTFEREEFIRRANACEIYWQNFRTLSKVILRDKFWKRLGYGGHQVEYGEGKYLSEHDPITASGSKNWGLFRAHLPYTSFARLQNRALFTYSDNLANTSQLFSSRDVSYLERVFSNMTIDAKSTLFSSGLDSGAVLLDDKFSESIEPVISLLKSSWHEIISAPKVVAQPSEINFSVLVDMAAEYINLLDQNWGGRSEK